MERGALERGRMECGSAGLGEERPEGPWEDSPGFSLGDCILKREV